ncbi:MAG: ATP-binding protein [Candidatus Poribacteria bacterium]
MSIKQHTISIRTRLILFIFIVAFAPLSIITFISIRYTEQMAKEILYSHLNSITQNKSEAIARWLSERITDVRMMADSKILYSMNEYEINKYLNLMKTHYLDYKRTVLIDLQGNILADTESRKENYRNEDWFQKSIKNGEYISDFFLKDDEMTFIIAKTIKKEGQIIGTLCEFIGLQYLNDFVTDIVLGKTGESYLVNKDGVIIAHKDKGRILKDKIYDIEPFNQSLKGYEKLGVYRNYLGTKVIGVRKWVTHRNIGNFNLPQWLLVAEQETSEIFAETNKYKIAIVIIFLSLFCIVILEDILISWSIFRPIKRLVDATSAVAKGNFDNKLEIDRMDELGRLTESFNNMVQQLRSYYDKLENRIISTRGELEKVSDELKRSKDALTRSEKLISLGQVSAGMAHEIRTPLTSIKLFVQSLEATLPIDDETQKDFALIKKETDRMEDIINRFLDFARPAEPKFEDVNINHILSEAITLIRTRLKDDKITINTKYDNNIPLIMGDIKQLKQVFLNILLNSIEAMPDGGEITVATNMINLSKDQKKLLKITISDTGCGIEADKIKYIFDPFFTTKDFGTGMGLAIAFTVIEQHGGMIEVDSKPSKGTTFTIYLPMMS